MYQKEAVSKLKVKKPLLKRFLRAKILETKHSDGLKMVLKNLCAKNV